MSGALGDFGLNESELGGDDPGGAPASPGGLPFQPLPTFIVFPVRAASIAFPGRTARAGLPARSTMVVLPGRQASIAIFS